MSKYKDLENKFEELKKEVSDQSYDPQKNKDETRSKIAKVFVYGFFGSILCLLIFILTYNFLVAKFISKELIESQSLILSFQEVFVTVISSITGLIGFVLGYYFKGKEA